MPDGHEPNNTPAQASRLTVTGQEAYGNLTLCADPPSHEDWYVVTVPAGAGLRVSTFPDEPPLQAAIQVGGAELGFSDEDPSPGTAVFGYAEETVDVRIRVRGDALGITYTLLVAVVPGGTCAPDGAEPSDVGIGRTPVSGPYPFRLLERSACEGDVDEYLFRSPVETGETRLKVTFPTVAGSVEARVMAASAPEVVLSTSQAVPGGLEITFPSSTDTDYILRVSAVGTGVPRYSVWPQQEAFCFPPQVPNPGTLEGAPEFPAQQLVQACAGATHVYRLPPWVRAGQIQVQTRSVLESGAVTSELLDASGAVVAATPVSLETQFINGVSVQVRTVAVETSATVVPAFVRVTPTSTAGQAEYELRAEGHAVCAPRVPGATRETPVPAGEPLVGEVCPQDAQHHRLEVTPAGDNAWVRARLSPGLVAQVVDGAGNVVSGPAEPDGDSVRLRFNAVEGETRLLRLDNPAPASRGWYNAQAFGPAPANDRCQDAIPLDANAHVEGSTLTAYDDVPEYAGVRTPGPDVFYTVEVPAGATLQAQLASCADQSLWLLQGCQELCVWAAVDRARAAEQETLVFTNTTAAALSLVLVVDARHGSLRTDFALDVQVE